MSRPQSASQTAGPYVHIGCTPSAAGLENMYGGNDLGADIFPPNTPGRKIVISGQVFDGAGDPVLDAMTRVLAGRCHWALWRQWFSWRLGPPRGGS